MMSDPQEHNRDASTGVTDPQIAQGETNCAKGLLSQTFCSRFC